MTGAPRRLPLLAPGLSPGAAPAAAGEQGEGGEGGHRAGAPRYRVETWGCQMNLYDSERFGGQLESLGWVAAGEAEDADLILLNTCSVRERAEEKLFSRLGRLRRLKRANPRLVIGVAGCVAQQERERILGRSDVVDFVVGTRAVTALPDLVASARAGRRAVDTSARDERWDEVRPIARGGSPRARITVIEGCDKSCSFCIVPTTRGPERSRAAAAVLEEARRAIAGGAVEVELLGQNVNAYRHEGVDFAGLLRMVDRLPGLRRVRFTTSHPREFTDAVIAAMAETERVCEHLHLPVQSGSTEVLKRMHRGYDRARYLSRIARLRARLPQVGLSTDVIVGFPGESEEQFRETLALLEEVEFDQVFAFVWSPRPFTHAARLDDPVPLAEKEERLRRLFALQDGISQRRNQAFVGRVVEVLAEGPSRRDAGRATGRTRDNRVVNYAWSDGAPGALVAVRVTRALAHSLLGEAVAV